MVINAALGGRVDSEVALPWHTVYNNAFQSSIRMRLGVYVPIRVLKADTDE